MMTTSTERARLHATVRRLEATTTLDPAIERLAPPAERLAAGPVGGLLGGRWLGHAMHPLLTDLPLGCWIGSGLLDLLGGRAAQRSSRTLVGLGLLFVPATAASGVVDWSSVDERPTKRIGVLHAVGNGIAASLYLLSWLARRRHRHLAGKLLSLGGGMLAAATGYLGGHMSFARGAGVGERWPDASSPQVRSAVESNVPQEPWTVGRERVHTNIGPALSATTIDRNTYAADGEVDHNG